MATLSRDELRKLASDAGFTGDDVDIAAAVALAESGGNTQAHNTTPPDDSYGLWQINMYGNLGPSRRRAYGLPSNDTLYDPRRNAMVAKHIKDSSGWNAWTTYTTDEYKQFMDKSLTDKIGSGIADATGLSAVASAVNSVGQNIFNGLASLVGIMVALVLLVLGVAILARNTKVVKGAKKAAVTAVVK